MEKKKKSTLREFPVNMKYLIGRVVSMDRWYLFFAVLKIWMDSIARFVIVLFPTYIIQIAEERDFRNVKIALVCFLAVGALVYSAVHFLNSVIDVKNKRLDVFLKKEISSKAMRLSMSQLADVRVQNQLQLAKEMVANVKLSDVLLSVTNGIVNINIFLGIVYIISKINPILILLLLFILIVNVIVEKRRIRQRMEFDEETIGLRREIDYPVNLMKDAKAAKEIRIFHMQQFLYDTFQRKYSEYEGAYYKTRPERLGWYFINFLCEAVRDFAVYVYAALKLLANEITISEFYLYTVSMNQLYLAMKGVFDTSVSLAEKARYIGHIRNFLLLETSELPDEIGKDICDKRLEFEFRNVYFKYEGQDEYVLKDINLKIGAGDILGIIGENGAGKSTLIKLLLGLYRPCEGSILLNGVDISEYSYKKYMELFSVMFQEDLVLPYSIRENVLFEKSEDGSIVLDEMYKNVLLEEKIRSLKDGEGSILSRELNDNGIELSGGEQQKLMIMRGMVKQAKFYVFDEPVSAISPLAEYEVMSHLFEHIREKTCIVISHRMSFVNQCKQIIFMEKGRIIAQGTHKELMERNEKYKEMYNIQSKWYVN